MAQLELLNALNSITSEAELNEFKNLLAHYFAQKAQKAIERRNKSSHPPKALYLSKDFHPRHPLLEPRRGFFFVKKHLT